MWCASSLFVRIFLSSVPAAVVLIGGGGLYCSDPASAKSPPCPVGYFRNSTAVPARCSPCSGCPINHIVRRPCGRQDDTVCGPFYEFEFQRQSNGTPIGEPRYFSNKVGYRLTNNGYAPADDGLVTSSTSSNSPEEAITVRCGQPQWRMLCYGLVAALVVVVSVALTVFALFAYCRSSVKTVRLDDAQGVRGGRAGVDDSSETSTIIVGRDVRHLEEQLIHNQRRKAFLRWLFGSSVTADRLFSSNDYLDERHRSRFIRMLDGASSGGGGGGPGGGGEALPLEPYPGMTLTGRTDRRRPTLLHPPNSNDDEETNMDGVDVVQTEERSAVAVGERSLLLSQEESNLET